MPANGVRITTSVARVLRQFLDDPETSRYGFDLMRATHLPSGTLYVILARLEKAGLLASAQEDVDPVKAGRPARRLYHLTADGVQTASIELAALSQQLQPPLRMQLRPTAQGG